VWWVSVCLHCRNLLPVHWTSLWLTSSHIYHPPKTASIMWTSANHLQPGLACMEDGGKKKCSRRSASASAMCKWSLLSGQPLYILRSRRHSSYTGSSSREVWTTGAFKISVWKLIELGDNPVPVTLTATKLTWSEMALNMGLHNEKSPSHHFNYGTATPFWYIYSY
jgi:hypothetical protein